MKLEQLRLPPVHTMADVEAAAAKKLHRSPAALTGRVELLKKSLDARKKNDIHWVIAAEVHPDAGWRQPRREPAPPVIQDPPRVMVVGAGPGGLMAALTLARAGYRPTVIERGRPVEDRARDVERFWRTGVLDTGSNVQFGEGGAGAFSDGKLTTGIKDPRIQGVLRDFVDAGAPEEILYLAKPHVGTDRLRTMVRNLRETILSLGGTFRFETTFSGVTAERGRLRAALLQDAAGRETEEACDALILAIGHSARDTFERLRLDGLRMEPKPFSAGVRIEHPQELIDRSQYGRARDGLPAADYKLAVHLQDGRGVYTFCMCPGGYVVAAASEEGCVVTNGMSYYDRAAENANSALLVSVTTEDTAQYARFAGDPLAGVAFQRSLERAAFEAGGGGYRAPAQRVEDFLLRRTGTGFGAVRPSYAPGVTPASLDRVLPGFVADSLRAALPMFGRKLKGFDLPDAVLTGVESRSSSPVRILRDENMQSNVAGIYPCGEGCGYAGGITSAAVDGVKCAEAVIRTMRKGE